MLCADALTRGADLLVTVGAEQSNHARITAAVGARIGLETHLVVAAGTRSPSGNQLLASLFGAHLHPAGLDSWSDLDDQMRGLVDMWLTNGRKPYSIPMGGSSPGYAELTPEADAAMVGLVRSGGWLFDRVYRAKGCAGLLAYDRDGTLGDGEVVFWHTGGQPAVFASNGALARSAESELIPHTTPSLDLEMT